MTCKLFSGNPLENLILLKENINKRYRKHDLRVVEVNLLFLEAEVYCSLLHRLCSSLMQDWHSY